ncbi:DUF3857 and transglutaminase domain-containing protein, partial [Myxococcota bacterium]|nr:DUF3857 and transglutaminase domain-containing protein [Myxococcota bacterium]
PRARMYYDLMETRLSFPPLQRGDIVEIVYSIESLPKGPRDGKFNGTIIQLQEFIPIISGDLHLYHSPQTAFAHAPTRSRGVTVGTDKFKGLNHISYHIANLPAVTVEPAMPGWGETLLAVITGPGLTWREIGRRYASFISPQYVLTPAISALSRKLLKGISSREEKIATIHSYVLKTYRYVALMFGRHSYLPYRTDEIISRRFGDCKDMTLLMILLLKAAGIEAWPSAVRTRFLGNIPTSIASLALFDHSIVYLPREKRWLDTTTKEVRYPLVPPYIQGRPALVISPRGGILTTTSASGYRDNNEGSVTRLVLDAKGGVRVTEKVTVRGAGEISWRLHLSLGRGATKWDYRYAKKGKTVLSHTNLRSLKSPLTISSTFQLKNLFTPRQGKLVGTLPFYEGDFIRRLAPFTLRNQDLLIDFPGKYTRNLIIDLPRGTCVKTSPADTLIKTPHLYFSQKIQIKKRSLHLHRTFILYSSRIGHGSYASFKKTVGAIHSAIFSPFQFGRCKQ